MNDLYSKPFSGAGGMPYFVGSRRQYGGNIFGALTRIIAPALKHVVKPLAKNVFHKALNVGKNVALDALQGQSVKDSFVKHAKNAATTTLQNLMKQQPTPMTVTTTTMRKRKQPPVMTGTMQNSKRQRRTNTTPTSIAARKKRKKKRQQSTTTGGEYFN